MSAQHKAVVEKVNAAFAANNTEGFLAHCAKDVEWTMVGDRTVKGVDAIRTWMASVSGDAPTFTVDQIVAEGEYVTCFGDMTMKDKDGSPAPYGYCDVYRFRDGRIAELRSYVVSTKPTEEVALL
jgi:ketosteroid isomerase-like protein